MEKNNKMSQKEMNETIAQAMFGDDTSSLNYLLYQSLCNSIEGTQDEGLNHQLEEAYAESQQKKANRGPQIASFNGTVIITNPMHFMSMNDMYSLNEGKTLTEFGFKDSVFEEAPCEEWIKDVLDQDGNRVKCLETDIGYLAAVYKDDIEKYCDSYEFDEETDMILSNFKGNIKLWIEKDRDDEPVDMVLEIDGIDTETGEKISLHTGIFEGPED